LQIVAAVRGVCSGTAEKFIAELAEKNYEPQLKDLLEKLAEAAEQLKNAVAFVKENGNEYMDLYGRALVDIAITLINGYLFCDQAGTKVDMEVQTASDSAQEKPISMKKRKAAIARRYITRNAPKVAALTKLIRTADKSTFTDYDILIGPVAQE
jgi:Asp-tRNA(Asn)/Glu-tRNA(Gln) amidotransferase A subunit family amidase